MIADAEQYLAYAAPLDLLGDGVQIHHALRLHHAVDVLAQRGDELVVELLVGVPRPPGDLLRGLQVEQHIQLLRLADHRPNALDQHALLQQLQCFREALLRNAAGHLDVPRPDAPSCMQI